MHFAYLLRFCDTHFLESMWNLVVCLFVRFCSLRIIREEENEHCLDELFRNMSALEAGVYPTVLLMGSQES